MIDVYLTHFQHSSDAGCGEENERARKRKSNIIQEEKPVAVHGRTRYSQRRGTSSVIGFKRGRILKHRQVAAALTVMIIVIVVAVFPTPRTTVSEKFSDSWSLDLDLTPGGDTVFHKVENHGSGTVSNFAVSVQSNATVNLTIIGVQGKTVLSGSWNYVYLFTGIQQSINFTSSYSSYLYGIFQPNGTDRSSAHVQGSVDTYSMNTTSHLLPWWMP